MSFQTSELVDGQWVSRQATLNDVLQQVAMESGKRVADKVEKIVTPPVYGLLTRTVIESPVFNWILPARIRHKDKNDVVFIGDNLVQLRELHADSRFRDIASQSDFGSRIRSALVIGNVPLSDTDLPYSEQNGNEDVEMRDASPVSQKNGSPTKSKSKDDPLPRNPFPPQYIVLSLESGDMVFLYARDRGQEGDGIEFVTKRCTLPGEMLSIQPGAHLAVDPSGRYMTLSCFEHLFAIYKLNTASELKLQHARNNFSPIDRMRYMSLEGILHKMEFLYPSSQDPNRIILLMIVVNKGRTAMFVYVWDAGCELGSIGPQNPRGHRVHAQAELPLLLIPLRINSNFLLVSEDKLMLCKDILGDAPIWVVHDAPLQEATESHHGSEPPIFTAWARPRRMKSWAETHDPIYIAREDGRIKQIEIESENDIEGIMDAGTVGCNIGKAFAYVDFADQEARKDAAASTKMDDILVVGGDMSNGGTFSIAAREDPKIVESISNWSPTLDFVVVPTTDGRTLAPSSEDVEPCKTNGKSVRASVSGGRDFSWPDRIFACSGRGKNGAIVELRYGLEARIDLCIDCEDETTRKSWVFTDAIDDGLFFLVSSPEHSTLLHLSNDRSNCPSIFQDSTWLDLSSPTILAEQYGDFIVQVSESGTLVCNLPPGCTSAKLQDMMDKDYREATYPASPGTTNIEAVLQHDVLFMITRIGLGSQIEMRMWHLSLENEAQLTQIFDPIILTSEPTCLALAKLSGEVVGIYASASEPGYVYTLGKYGNVKELALCRGDVQCAGQELYGHICHSLAVIQDGHYPILLCGFRDGSFRTYLMQGSPAELKLLPRDSTQLGTTAVTITRDSLSPEAAFIRCDSDVYRFTFDKAEQKDEPSMSSLHRMWHTDDLDMLVLQPFVNSVTRYSHHGYRDDGNLLITSDSKLILASLDPRPKAVPRTIGIGATPTAIFYSADLQALVVAVLVPSEAPPAHTGQSNGKRASGRTDLYFVSPDSGHKIAQATNKDGTHVQFVKGLGNNEKIMSIGECKFYKDGATFLYILVGLSSGSLLVISTKPVATKPVEDEPNFLFWTRHIIHDLHSSAVYSFAGIDDNLFICIGNFMCWYYLDTTEKKFKRMEEWELPSPGISIEVEGNLIIIITARHSMMVLQFDPHAPQAHRKLTQFYYVTDQVARSGLHQLAIPQCSIRLISDRSMSVAGLWFQEKPQFTDVVNTIFEAELTTAIVKFKTGTARRKLNKLSSKDTELFEAQDNTIPSDSVSGPDVIFGIGIDGSVHHFEVLPEKVWIVLRYIQNMAMHSEKVCPFTWDKVARDQYGNHQIDPVLSTETIPATAKHVDGDILARCKSLGRDGFKALLESKLPDEDNDNYDDDYDDELDDRDKRAKRFAELMKNCMSPVTEPPVTELPVTEPPIAESPGAEILAAEADDAKDEEEKDVYWEAYKLMCWYLRPVI